MPDPGSHHLNGAQPARLSGVMLPGNQAQHNNIFYYNGLQRFSIPATYAEWGEIEVK